jgi:hypothetical protein
VVSTIRLTPACRATGRFFGIIPVLAIQGAGYVVAGLAMLAWLKDGAGPPKSWVTGMTPTSQATASRHWS